MSNYVTKLQYPIIIEIMPPSIRIMDLSDLSAMAKILQEDQRDEK